MSSVLEDVLGRVPLILKLWRERPRKHMTPEALVASGIVIGLEVSRLLEYQDGAAWDDLEDDLIDRVVPVPEQIVHGLLRDFRTAYEAERRDEAA
ncbi:MAG: hypothetical protein AB7Q01_08530 [Gammaproteobacteria bacterium]